MNLKKETPNQEYSEITLVDIMNELDDLVQMTEMTREKSLVINQRLYGQDGNDDTINVDDNMKYNSSSIPNRMSSMMGFIKQKLTHIDSHLTDINNIIGYK
jgi:hypothetical protein